MSNQAWAHSRAVIVMKDLADRAALVIRPDGGLCRFYKMRLKAEMLCVFTGGVGDSAGSGAGGAGPAHHHTGAGEERQGVSHENCSE